MMACGAGKPHEEVAASRLFAQECCFVVGAAKPEQVPHSTLDEIAFAGRSNVGKSSLINGLVGRKNLARSSNTPGRTRQINFFELAGRLMLVDLPGYGFARASKSEIREWTDFVRNYLESRASLRRVCLLLDSRHDPKRSDFKVMSLLDKVAVSYMIVMTKTDKVPISQLEERQENLRVLLAKRPAAFPFIFATSINSGLGIDQLRVALARTDPLFVEDTN